MTKIGIKKSLMASVFFGMLYFVSLAFFESISYWQYLIVPILLVNVNRMLYWVQYHTDFAKFSDRKTRGKQISIFTSVASLVAVFLPLISGQILENYDFRLLFMVGGFIFMMSIIPLFFLPDKKAVYSYGYIQSFKKLFSRQKRRMLLSFAADGAQGAVGIAFWPLFIWLVLDKSYSAVGIVSSLIILFSIVVRLTVGDFSDRFNKKKMLKWGTSLYSIGWIVKMFVATGFQIFLASTYHAFAAIIMRTSYDSLMYDRAADAGDMSDEYSVLREMALSVGRILMILVVIVIFTFVGDITIAFMLAGLVSLLINLI